MAELTMHITIPDRNDFGLAMRELAEVIGQHHLNTIRQLHLKNIDYQETVLGWPLLANPFVLEKRRAAGKAMLFDTGNLRMQSFYVVERATESEAVVAFGSDAEYTGRHVYGRGVPRRNPFVTTEQEDEKLGAFIEQYIGEGFGT